MSQHVVILSRKPSAIRLFPPHPLQKHRGRYYRRYTPTRCVSLSCAHTPALFCKVATTHCEGKGTLTHRVPCGPPLTCYQGSLLGHHSVPIKIDNAWLRLHLIAVKWSAQRFNVSLRYADMLGNIYTVSSTPKSTRRLAP